MYQISSKSPEFYRKFLKINLVSFFSHTLYILLFALVCILYMCVIRIAMKVKVLCRNPDDYLRETKKDIHKGKSWKCQTAVCHNWHLVYYVLRYL